MKIKHYLYNSFLIEEGSTKIAIDPGVNLGLFKMHSLIPETEWPGTTHIVITHGDADHFKFALPLAINSKAKVICGEALAEDFTSQKVNGVHTINLNDVIELDDIKFEGLKVEHGTTYVKLGAGLVEMKIMLRKSNRGGEAIYFGPFRLRKIENELQTHNHAVIKFLFGLIRAEKDNVDWARGSMGYRIFIGSKSIVNLGDTLFMNEWEGLKPDVLMLPIGGLGNSTWTMDVVEALKAVEIISPRVVIPCHYSGPFLWQKNFCPADDSLFRQEVEKMGIECSIMHSGDEIEV
jgi:L-ascorbate metabolism protein UlaG (beta-lactamase superfamily)